MRDEKKNERSQIREMTKREMEKTREDKYERGQIRERTNMRKYIYERTLFAIG